MILTNKGLNVDIINENSLEDICWAYSYLTDNIDVDILINHNKYITNYDEKQNELLITGYLKQLQSIKRPKMSDRWTSYFGSYS